MYNPIHKKDGAAALITIIVLFAVILATGLVIAKFSLNELALDQDLNNSNQALHIAESCSDEASFRLKQNSSYTGGSISMTDGDCSVSVSGSGSTRTLTVSASLGSLTRELSIDVDLDQNLGATADRTTITTWYEN